MSSVLIAAGEVVDVEKREWRGRDGQTRVSHAMFLRAPGEAAGRDAATKVDCDVANVHPVGSLVECEISIRANDGARGPWVSIWARSVQLVKPTALKAAAQA